MAVEKRDLPQIAKSPIDITKEQVVPLEKSGQYFPLERPPARPTLFRWGSRGSNGVVLETIRIGRSRLTSVEAIHRFIAAQNQGSGASVPSITQAQRKRQSDAANRLLQEAGL